MPTFFDSNALTPEQQSRWDAAVVEYERVQQQNIDFHFNSLTSQAMNFFKGEGAETDVEIRAKLQQINQIMGAGAGHPKSALFARLLEGKQALPFRPPCSHSYPWYSVIEDAGPWDLGMMNEGNTVDDLRYHGFDEEAARPGATWPDRVLLNQTAWNVISQSSPTEALVTYGDWAAQGYRWRLVRELVNTLDSQRFILSYHDKSLGRITTLPQLKQEQRWHACKRYLDLKYALDDELASAFIAAAQAKSGFDAMCAQGQLDQARKTLMDRRAASLPDYPTEQEIESEAQSAVAKYLSRDHWASNDGHLFVWTWRLHRVEPNKPEDEQ